MRRDVYVILLLLGLAAVTDHLTGVLVSASAFYIFPVAWAGWRLGWKAGVATLLGAMSVNVLTEWSRPVPALYGPVRLSNEALRFVVFTAVCVLSILLRREHNNLEEQRNRLSSLYERLEEEMQAAGAIQRLLIGSLPHHPAVDLASHFQASRILGGDILSVTLLTDDRLAVAIGDVSGKGSPAALAGAVALGLLHETPSRLHSPAETLRTLNQQLVGRLPEEMFITFFYALIDLSTGKMVYALAGHECPFLVPPAGPASLLPPGGLPLGLFPGAEFTDLSLRLSPGDLLFCYTDGLTDVHAPSGERFGLESLQRQIELRSRFPCELLVKNLIQETVGGRADPPDDISLLSIRYLG